MAAQSELKELTQTYELIFSAAVETFLVQCKSIVPVRVVSVVSETNAPDDDESGYINLLHNKVLTREGLEGLDLYMRSDSDTKNAYIVAS